MATLEVEFRLDQESTGHYGTWVCPECHSHFYGGGEAIHESGCSRSGYSGLIYKYTTSELNAWREKVQECGYATKLPLSPMGLADHLLMESITGGIMSVDEIRVITERYVRSVDESRLPIILSRLDKLIMKVK